MSFMEYQAKGGFYINRLFDQEPLMVFISAREGAGEQWSYRLYPGLRNQQTEVPRSGQLSYKLRDLDQRNQQIMQISH